MTKFYIVVEIEEEGKKYVYTIDTTSSTNIFNLLNRTDNIMSATIFKTKKEATAQVNFLQNIYKQNNVNLY